MKNIDFYKKCIRMQVEILSTINVKKEGSIL